MTTTEADVPEMRDPEGHLESALIDEFLRARGLDRAALRQLAGPDATRFWAEASAHVTAKLAEIEARARLLRELRGEA